MKQPKTECPFCGDVWQEHTVNQVDACTAIMKEMNSRARRNTKNEVSAFQFQPGISICPVCKKPFVEHADADLNSCAGKLRKRERGTLGFELQSHFWDARCKNEEPDPAKRATLRAQMLQSLCSCGKTFGDHMQDEILTCARKQRDLKLKDVRCPICNKLVLEHSQSESVACSEKDRAAKQG